MAKVKASEALVGFGFTGLESEVYAFLLQESPATGYRIAQAIRKPAANTYKAIESLEAKGAIVVDASGAKTCSPVPAETLIKRLSREFQQKATSALKSFEGLNAPPLESKLHAITAADQLLREAEKTIRSAESVLLVVGNSNLVRQLADSIEEVCETGVDTYVVSNEPLNMGSATTLVLETLGDPNSLEVGADDQIVVAGVAVGAQAEGLWTQNHPMAKVLFSGMLSKVALQLVKKTLDEDGSKKQISRILESVS